MSLDVDQLFAQKEQQYGLPAGYLKRTWQLESGGGKNLYNPGSRAAGHFQFLPSTAKAYGLADPYDLEQSADAAARLARDNKGILQRNGIESPTGAQLYLGHQQGGGGAVKLLNGGDAPATSLVGQGAVLGNGGDQSVTGPQFANRITSKFDYGTQPGGYAYSAAGGLNSPRENIAMANPGSAAPDNRPLDNQPKDGTAIGDAAPTGVAGLLGNATPEQFKGVQGLLDNIQKNTAANAAAANAQTQALWQAAARGGGGTQPMRPFTGWNNGLLG